MKKRAFIPLLLLSILLMIPLAVSAEQQPEVIAGKMAVKLTRGLANAVTAPVELPKQIILTGRDMGAVGYLVVGPLKGIGMTFYRGIIGLTETVFFAVPQPGYYDPTIDPAYVWEGWEPTRRDMTPIVSESAK
ncbi:MAG: exosortase system-associated protein, TIGR04073 family [Desulfuromonadales bacterium]|nr:exosortase system-associated protein, TIGR04073 family [Desulfuromonadales bacterium]